MRHPAFILLLACISLFATSCGGDQQDKEAARFDSLKLAQSESQVTFKNKDIIQPPDTDYTGNYIDRYKNGIIKFRGDFRFGKRHGQWLAFYLNGEKWSECFYDKGLKHGSSMIYYPNGKLQMTGWYANDLRDSIWTFYDTNGVVLQQVRYKNDEEVPVTKAN